jgi:hypothetical protein
VAQICDAFLRARSERYKKEGAKIPQRFLAQRQKKRPHKTDLTGVFKSTGYLEFSLP